MFSPMVRAPLTCGISASDRAGVPVLGDDDLGRVGVVLADERARALGEGLPVLLGPPVADLSGAVEGGALVIEAVADLVADDGTDPRVVHGVVGLRVEEGGLKNRGGEDDLVHGGGCSRH